VTGSDSEDDTCPYWLLHPSSLKARGSLAPSRSAELTGARQVAKTWLMLACLVARLRATVRAGRARIRRWTRSSTRPVLGFVLDRCRSPQELVRENALLRKQLEVACRHITRPKRTGVDRAILVLLARLTPTWRATVLLVRPETILRWHRQGFKLLWRRRSRRGRHRPRTSGDTIALIERMVRNNRLWGAERIRGELLKLGIRIAKRTIQKHLRRSRDPRPPGQSWATFLRNHGNEVWACDFLQVYDLLFRPLFAFFLIELGSRRVVHVAVTRSPSSAWVTQQLREATAWGAGPRFLIRDHDDKFGGRFDVLAGAMGIKVLHTPVRAPNANAVCERFLRSVRAECLDHVLVLREAHLRSTLRRYCSYFNAARPHQGIGQQVPDGPPGSPTADGSIEEIAVLGGLHHAYRRAA
jgi:putative transposase